MFNNKIYVLKIKHVLELLVLPYFREEKKLKKNIHNKPSNSLMCLTYLHHSSKAKVPITSYRDTNRQTICKMVELEKELHLTSFGQLVFFFFLLFFFGQLVHPAYPNQKDMPVD